jgi:hypothetical protein
MTKMRSRVEKSHSKIKAEAGWEPNNGRAPKIIPTP